MGARAARSILAFAILAAVSLALAACGGGGGSKTATPPGAAATTPAVMATTPTTVAGTTTAAPTASGSATTAASPTASGGVDPCTLRPSLEGGALAPGVGFALDPQTKWQLCNGGAAAGSSEKYLFHTTDGGASWTLISETTLGVMTPEAGVGAFPNGNGVDAMLFRDATHGWIGLTSPGGNLFRSTDGGVTWTANADLPPGLPVTAISFSDASNGTLQTPDGPWHTTDGGDHWVSGAP